jgi:hypothetical protein
MLSLVPEEENAMRGLIVASSAATLLIEILDGFAERMMNDEPHIRLVNTHA